MVRRRVEISFPIYLLYASREHQSYLSNRGYSTDEYCTRLWSIFKLLLSSYSDLFLERDRGREMERFTVTASFNGGLSQRPSSEAKEVSPSYTSFPSKPILRDISFSSYIQPEGPKPVAENSTKDTELSIFDAERYFTENPDRKENQKSFSSAIYHDRNVERCDLSTVPRLSSVSSVDGYGRNYRTGSFNATPTASSEASWNSQSGLLSNPPGSIAVSIKNLPLHDHKKGPSRRWLFGRKCPCSGKKSVDVREKFPEPKNQTPLNCNFNGNLIPQKQNLKGEEAIVDTAPNEKTEEREENLGIEERVNLKLVTGNWAKGEEAISFPPENRLPVEIGRRIAPPGRSFNDVGGFSFPILNPATAGKLLKNGKKPASPPEEPPRESLEVFHPTDETIIRKSTEFQKRLMMPFTGDNGRQSFTFPASPMARTTTPAEDDVLSDSSSDLFEIESFSTQTTLYPMYRRRDSLDEISSFEERRLNGAARIFHFRRSLDEMTTPSIAPTECYEPSEVSVDWSVTTAEGVGSVANFSIAASDYEEVRFIPQEPVAVAGGYSKRRANGLLSCQSEKAVSVGPRPVKYSGTEQNRMGPPPNFPVESGRVSAMAKMANVGLMQVARVGSAKPPLARSHSARLSLPLATR
ncbi:protein PHYTOCHROME KINASE SUBSTRATE 4-like [Tasmannia lanceolata]|uniref:protein PHYTOCHROME KINASE SUBSTRATE 4-like n=1 Tax=Tasmannia lanceolata TaxID=3420 RepID=UPI0040635463